MAGQDGTAGTSAARSPGAPWSALTDRGGGYLSVYLSDPLARWPVREVTRPGDNKSDPNIETGTYGLFSTCEPGMRNRIVHDGAATIFFLTTRRRGEGRVLTGYYHVGWYTEGTQGAINRDYSLAASDIRFIKPLLTRELPGGLAGVSSAPFRTMKPIETTVVARLRELCDQQADRTAEYIAEVERLERFARARSGYAYPSWGREESFTWSDAPAYYRSDAGVAKVPNSTRSGRWRCSECEYVIQNSALLKRCPLCKSMSSLAPVGGAS